MTVHEQNMLGVGCPECGGDIELYETNPSGTGGKYRCKQCGRDTVWAVGRTLSFTEMIAEMKAKMASLPNVADIPMGVKDSGEPLLNQVPNPGNPTKVGREEET